MFVIKQRNNDDGKAFTDVHHLMKYFKDMIYEDLKSASEGSFEGVALLSYIFEQNLTFKDVCCSGKKSIRTVAKQFYTKTVAATQWRAEHQALDWQVENFLKSMQSIPQNTRVFLIYKKSAEGDWLEPIRTPWRDFFDEYFSKKSTILSEEEKAYKLE